MSQHHFVLYRLHLIHMELEGMGLAFPLLQVLYKTKVSELNIRRKPIPLYFFS